MSKILVLSTNDNHLRGHGWFTAETLKNEGHEVCFLALNKSRYDTDKYIYDRFTPYKRFNPNSIFYIKRHYWTLTKYLNPLPQYCFMSPGLWGVSADKILNKCPFIPDYIYITWVANFLTPKIIRNLHNKTNAPIVFSMVDEAILGACHFPCECTQYMNGCYDCPALPKHKWVARKVVSEKEKYWIDMPAHIIGSGFDLKMAKKTPYLKHMQMHKEVSVPDVSPIYTKDESRKYFNLSNDDFVVFAGANNVKDVRKGFGLLQEAINKFISRTPIDGRRVTLLILGQQAEFQEFSIDHRINVIRRDFLPFEHFLKAYYACDIHVSSSIADSGPQMINYSIACGTPVVCFPIGIALDLVVHERTGYLANYMDTDDMAVGIEYFYNKSVSDMENIKEHCLLQIGQFEKMNPRSFLK